MRRVVRCQTLHLKQKNSFNLIFIQSMFGVDFYNADGENKGKSFIL